MRESEEPVARSVLEDVSDGGERARQRTEEVWAVKRKVSAKEMVDFVGSSAGDLVALQGTSGSPSDWKRMSEGIDAIMPWRIRSYDPVMI